MSAVPGSLPRRILFWAHLSSGVLAGLVILLLSLTGILLAYEKQIVASAAKGNRVVAPADARALSPERLVAIVHATAPRLRRVALVFDADARAPVTAPRGRDEPLLLNPYTGAVIPDAAASTRAFLRTVANWHRWLGGTGTSVRASAVDIANLLFVFMVTSGVFLWLPATWRWRTVRGLVLFRSRYVNAQVRDFNWHHVLGAWMLVPLLVISSTGAIMSFGWANDLLFALYGESGMQHQDNAAEYGGGAPSTLRRTLLFDAATAALINAPAVRPTPGQRARSWVRSAHTGEEYGVPGQTLAAIASLAACFLVYTGLALAWRRLILRR